MDFLPKTEGRILRASGALLAVAVALAFAAPPVFAWSAVRQTTPPAAQAPSGPGSTVRPVGTVKAINGAAITLTTDAGADVTIQVQDTTRILRVEPGQKDLKTATAAKLQDVQVGDRLLVGGKLGDDSKTVMASTMVVMKHADVVQTQDQERADWQQHGIGGLVSAVDSTQGSVVITQTSVAGVKKTITIQASADTNVRRYAPQSVKFEDAQTSTLAQIKPGDQIRARGTMGADGTSFSAVEIVSGQFRNISGTVSSVDATAGTLTVMDLATKKQVLVHISTGSQVRKLAPFMALRLAARLKGIPAGGAPGNGGAVASQASANPGAAQGNGAAGNSSPTANGGPGGGGGGGYRAGGGGGGGADLQQMLARLPASTLADFQKGDAVMIVSTEGTASGGVTAITLLGGVEPILDASPSSGSAILLSPWSIGGPSGADAGE